VIFLRMLMWVFERILVGLDGSEHSLKALETAIQIAKGFSGKLTLIYVYSVAVTPIMVPEPSTLSPTGIPAITAEEVARVADAVRGAGRQVLAEGEQKVKAEKVQVETMLIEGHAVQEIVRVAKEGKFDMIVIGAKGISKIRELLLGSVTDGVIHHAACPVLVVK
jgi:nucleotide-binding universal stress UspA family protein